MNEWIHFIFNHVKKGMLIWVIYSSYLFVAFGLVQEKKKKNSIYYCRQESLRRNGVAHIVNKRVQNAVLVCSLRNHRMISVRFQGKPSNITVVKGPDHWHWRGWSWPILRRPTDLLELAKKTRCLFHHRGLECKSRKSRDTWSNS